MELKAWIDLVPGRQTALADHFGITQSAVSQWLTVVGVPVDRMPAVVEYTAGEVDMQSMVMARIALKAGRA